MLLVVFAVFIAVTLVDIDPDLLAFSGYPSLSKIVASVALTFFAYLGFNVITFTAGDLADPARELPKAMYSALGVTSLIYVLIALGVFGALTVTEVDRIRRDRDRRSRATGARRRRLHRHGDRRAARDRQLDECHPVCLVEPDRHARQARLFPSFFGPESRLGARAGLFITAALVLVVANLVDLSAIASVGSAVALVIFLLVGAAGYRRRADTGSNTVIVVLAIAVTATVLAFFAVDTLETAPETFGAIIAIGLLSVVLDALVRRGRPDRRRPNRPDREASASLSD